MPLLHPGPPEISATRSGNAGPYRLGIALGAGSLGWCALDCDSDGVPVTLRDGGVRIFQDGRDPKTGSPLGADRRNARIMRRRRDRYLRRRAALLEELVKLGLMPGDECARKALESVDPYHIRAVALDEQVPLHLLGRALFHLNQRRGFRSSRKADRMAEADELGIVASGMENLDAAMIVARARTYGEFLALRRALDPARHPAAERSARIRRDHETGAFSFFPARRHLEAEFEALWQAQQRHYPAILTDDARTRIARIMFFQRAMKSPPVARCAYTGEKRMAKAHPLFQRLCLLKRVNELKVACVGQDHRPLTRDERDRVLSALRSRRSTRRSIAWNAVRKSAGLSEHATFQGEDRAQAGLAGDVVEAEMVQRFGPEWRDLSLCKQWRIVERLKNEEEQAVLLTFLQQEFNLAREHAEVVAEARLPAGYARIGEQAALRLLAELEADVICEREAIERCGWTHRAPLASRCREQLPYYGEILEYQLAPGSQDPADPPEECFGRVHDPSVHVSLGQLRRVVNGLIARCGRPGEIVVAVSPDLKLSARQRSEIRRIIKRSTQAAIERGARLETIGVPNTGANRIVLQLWEELHPDPAARACIYTGTPITRRMLFSGATAVDHILPIGSTLDDSKANMLLVLASAWHDKGVRTPHAAFGQTSAWEAILSRARSLPANKSWRFAPDALDRYGSEAGGFEQHLSDGAYIPRLVQTYLEALYPEAGEGRQPVRVIRSDLIEAMRRGWDLNKLLPDKDYARTSRQGGRRDHRHRLIDALVVALSDEGTLQDVATQAQRNARTGASSIFIGLSEPWSGFRKQLSSLLDAVIVSHRADHGTLASARDKAAGRDRTAGRLHNDTAYGSTGQQDPNGNDIVVRRVPLLWFDRDEKIAAIRDLSLRAQLTAAVAGTSGAARREALRRFAKEHPIYRDIRRARIIEPAKTVSICDRMGRPYKAYKGNAIHHIDIWRLPGGAWVSKWVDENAQQVSSAVQMFDAHRTGADTSRWRPHPAARKVLSLQQNDVIALDHPLHGECICRVVKLRETGQVTLARHMEAGNLLKRNACEADPFKYFSPNASGLQKLRARQIRIDALGKVWDPGPRD